MELSNLFSGIIGAFCVFILQIVREKYIKNKQKKALGKILYMDLINFYNLVYASKDLKTVLYKAQEDDYSNLWREIPEEIIRLIPPRIITDVIDSYRTIETLKGINKTEKEINDFIEIYNKDLKEKPPRQEILDIIEKGIKKLEKEINQNKYTLEDIKNGIDEKYIKI